MGLFGAGPDTGNLGVSALCYATVGSLLHRVPSATCTVFDFQRGVGDLAPQWPSVRRAGAMLTRRWYRPESYAAIDTALYSKLPLSKSATEIRRLDALLDISGGDSFSDLYGPHRFKGVVWPKLLALRLNKPLILLPQTYGPFRSKDTEAVARRMVRGATAAWARDTNSFEILSDLLGDAFDPERHRCGVDVAFLLPTDEPPAALLPESLNQAIADGRPLVGLNVSGLIFNDPKEARDRYRFKADYRELVLRFARWLLEQDDADLVLVPHVLAPPGMAESDPQAINEVARECGRSQARVHIVPPDLNAAQTKWVISRCAWFCGTRMHATIAGLSSGVCTATISYSDKAKGVFAGCGLGDAVVDPREMDTEPALEAIQHTYLQRADLTTRLTTGLSSVMRTAESQMDQIAGTIRDRFRERVG